MLNKKKDSSIKNKGYAKKKTFKSIKKIIGIKSRNQSLYLLSVTHSSVSNEYSNERLEFLGDAILDAVVADYLFKKFPFKAEGFLTDIRSRIVNRESLNSLARKIGLDTLIEYSSSAKKKATKNTINGNALEALIGAVYVDKGYKISQKFIVKRLISPHIDIDLIVNTPSNFKSILLEWGQKNSKPIEFTIGDKDPEDPYVFSISVLVGGEISGMAKAKNKKKAQQMAAEEACKSLNLVKHQD
ncbi:MAG: ribonuclease III [Cyclobacteriaceae bacterium]